MIRAGVVGAALVVVLARTLAYAAQPSPAARVLEGRAGGPGLAAIALVALTLGASVAVAVCWLTALAVRERAFLECRHPVNFATRRTLALAAALSATTCVAGGLLEAYLHWRAGLGWHGVHCLVGPVHRDLLPIETALSFVAAAVIAAGAHLVAWMRRTFAALRAAGLSPSFCSVRQWSRAPLGALTPLRIASPPARGPPRLG